MSTFSITDNGLVKFPLFKAGYISRTKKEYLSATLKGSLYKERTKYKSIEESYNIF